MSVLLECQFNVKTPIFQTKHDVTLYERHLVLRETDCKEKVKVIEFELVKCDWIIKPNSYGFKFQKGEEILVLMTSSFRDFE